MNDTDGTKGGGGVSTARRLYAVKFDIISLTARSRGSVPVNKQGATCYIAPGADLRLFVLSTCLFLFFFLRGGTIYKAQARRGARASIQRRTQQA